MTGANGTTVPNIGKPAADPDPVTYSTDLNVRSFNGINTDQVKNPSLGTVTVPGVGVETQDYAAIAPAALGGKGTIEDPYTIGSIAQYKNFEMLVNGTAGSILPAGMSSADSTTITTTEATPRTITFYPFANKFIKLMRNLNFQYKDASGKMVNMTGIPPIGGGLTVGKATFFSGTFDGNDKSLLNWNYINSGLLKDIGIFGTVSSGTIKNLSRIGGETDAKQSNNVGGIVGRLLSSSIVNTRNTGSVSGSGSVGGVVGYSSGDVINAINTGVINGTGINIGGVAGSSSGEAIHRFIGCINSGTVKHDPATGGDVGGIVGDSWSEALILNCYNAGDIVAACSNVGGIIGAAVNSYSPINLKNCYNTGAISGNLRVGSIIGSTHGDNGNIHASAQASFLTLENVYSLQNAVKGSTDALWGDDIPTTSISSATDNAMVSADMQLPAFVDILNAGQVPPAFKIARQTAEYQYPWLRWQMKDIDTVYAADLSYVDFDAVSASASFEGNGNTADPYLIRNFEDYKLLYDTVLTDTNGTATTGKVFRLEHSLDFNGMKNIKPIGGNAAAWNVAQGNFRGTFNGNRKNLYNLTILSNQANVGVFGLTQGGAIVENLGKVGGIVSNTGAGSNSVTFGGIIGRAENTAIRNCYNTGKVIGLNDSFGGISGVAYLGSTILNCYNTGAVKSTVRAGGITGGCDDVETEILGCYNTGYIQAGTNVGGIAGDSYRGTTIKGCYNIGKVDGERTTAAAIVGKIVEDTDDNTATYSITNCFGLTGMGAANQVVGVCPAGTVTTGSAIGSESVLKSNATLNALNTDLAAGQKFIGVTGDYPKLPWQ